LLILTASTVTKFANDEADNKKSTPISNNTVKEKETESDTNDDNNGVEEGQTETVALMESEFDTHNDANNSDKQQIKINLSNVETKEDPSNGKYI
jgi:hypothetical protein